MSEITTEHAEAISEVAARALPIMQAIKDMADQWATVERGRALSQQCAPMVPTGVVPRGEPAPAPRQDWQQELDGARGRLQRAVELLNAKLPQTMVVRIKQKGSQDDHMPTIREVCNRWQHCYTVSMEFGTGSYPDIVLTLTRKGAKDVA